MANAAYGGQMAKYYGLRKADSLSISPVAKPPITITHLVSNAGLPEQTASIPPEKAFVVSVHLTPASPQGCDLWIDEKHSQVRTWPPGGVGIYDLESNPRKRNPSPVDWVHYYVPRTALDAFADDAELPRIQCLRCDYGKVDPVLHQLTRVILPSLQDSHLFSDLFLDYFRLLFCAHVGNRYAPPRDTPREFHGGLAPWQRKRALELFRENLEEQLRLTTLATECGLSVSHFARSFRRTFGMSAHRYLILQRIERSKQLLTTTRLPLIEVGLQSGFSDQAAFSRTFRAVVGASPGRWQREVMYSHKPIDRVQ